LLLSKQVLDVREKKDLHNFSYYLRLCQLLKLIEKGVTVEQVARVNRNFTEAGILVHAYLMYGFPTQTAQETIDSLEMVRQLFEAGIMQSGFWHQFAMTAHSPVGMNPDEYKVIAQKTEHSAFANNDVPHVEMNGAIHDKFSFGLKKSLFNYMHGMCLDWPLNEWFDFKVPRTSIQPDYIVSCLENELPVTNRPNQKVVWLGTYPYKEYFEKKKKGKVFEMVSLIFYTKNNTITVDVAKEEGDWFASFIEEVKGSTTQTKTYQEMKTSFETACSTDFELFWFSKPVQQLREMALLVV